MKSIYFEYSSNLKSVKNIIRYGLQEDTPSIVSQWLVDQANATKQLSIQAQRKAYESQYNLLLETIMDDLVPIQWRRLCLDQIYRPLNELRKLSSCDDSEQRLRHLFYELSISCQYVRRSLSQ